MDPDAAALARARGGVIVLPTLRHDLVERRLASGELVRTGRRSAVAATTPPSWDQRLFVVEAEVGEPMAITGLGGLRVYDAPHCPPPPSVLTVLVPSERDPLDVPGVRLIRAGPGDLAGLRRVHDHPVACLEVVLRYSALETNRQKMITLLQDALRLQQTTELRLLAVTGRGRAGSRALRQALDVAGDRAHSRQERRLHRRMLARGLAGCRRGVNISTDDGSSYWLDFFWELLRAGLEVNGGVHLDPVQAAYDARRARRILTQHGIVLLPLTAAEVDADVDGAVDEVERFLISRAAALGVPVPRLEP